MIGTAISWGNAAGFVAECLFKDMKIVTCLAVD